MADLQKIIDDLSKLTVLEAADLAKRLEEKWENELPTPGLSAEELKRARADLEVWCAPEEFFQKVEVLAKKTSSEELFNAPRLGFLLDAMILGEFARQLEGARRVRLAAEADRFPDGLVETPNGTLNIEVTEVDRETRRRGDEYKAGTTRGETVDDWDEQAKAIPAELERVILKKIDKRYNPAPTLVVYLNLNGHGARQDEIESIIEDAKRKHASSFQGIHILWNGRLL
jgi:Ribosomal protein L7/L12 dimerisation domain